MSFQNIETVSINSIPYTPTVVAVTPAITATALASAAHVSILPASSTTSQVTILDIFLNGVSGTGFSGNSGNRLLSITDGTTVYSIIPAATLGTLTNSKWGVTALPAPVSVAWSTLTAAGMPLYAVYSGGSADYTAGSVTLTIVYQVTTL